MRNLHVYLLSAALGIFAVCVFLYKVLVTGLPVVPGQLTSAWEVEKRITFEATGGPAKLTVNIPGGGPGMSILGESVVAPKYGVTKVKVNGNRQVTLSIRKASGLQSVYVRTIVSMEGRVGEIPKPDPPDITAPELSEAQLTAATELIETAEAKSSDVPTFVSVITQLAAEPENIRKITGPGRRKITPAQVADAAVTLLSIKGIGARRVNGINLKASRQKIQFEYWLEVFVKGNWQAFALDGSEAGVPDTYLPWSRGTKPPARLTGGKDLKTNMSAVRLEQSELFLALEKGTKVQDRLITFSLFSLPLATQEVYRVLMVVPLGIFILVVLRNVIGVKSLGTFMPVLIALAFRETQLLWGIILFTAVVSTGLLFRFYLEQLKLLLVPRLASVLIFVVIAMAVSSVLTNALGFERGLSVALFPMVILAMTIERVSVIWDERGPREAIIQAIGSLMIASLCHVVMTQPIVEHLFYTFPELLLVLLALTILLGRYTWYRLLELWRFESLGKEMK